MSRQDMRETFPFIVLILIRKKSSVVSDPNRIPDQVIHISRAF